MMILHTGIDGGLHDLLFTSALGALAWGCLAVNAIVYYSRRLIQRFKRGGK